MRYRVITALLALVVGLGVALPATAQTNANFYREVTFANATVVTVDVNGTGAAGFADATLAAFLLSCTEDSGTATLDVAMQRSIDGGTTWNTIVSFTQLSATGSEVKVYSDLRAASAQMIGDRLRASFDVTGTGQYTCSVKGALEA